jgi:transcriptional regulator with XRE-family HTH domain
MTNQSVIETMNTNEKIVALRDLSGLNQFKFSQLIGVAPSTMTRLERGAPNKPSIETLRKIAEVFEEVTLEWLEDEQNEQMPPKLTISGSRSSLEAMTAPDNEGQRLRRFIERYKPLLNQQKLADVIGVTRNQVHSYTKTQRFHRDVRKSLLSALSKILDRPVTMEELFGSSGSSATLTPTSLIAIPRLSVADRPNLSIEFVADLQNNFMPAVQPDSAMYAPKSAVAPDMLKRAYAIEVDKSDRMEPLYFPGYWVLGMTVEANEHARLHDGTVAVLTTDGEFLVKKVLANNLRTTGILELGSYSTDRGSSLQLRKTDIQLMFQIVGIIFGITG